VMILLLFIYSVVFWTSYLINPRYAYQCTNCFITMEEAIITLVPTTFIFLFSIRLYVQNKHREDPFGFKDEFFYIGIVVFLSFYISSILFILDSNGYHHISHKVNWNWGNVIAATGAHFVACPLQL